MKELNNKIDYCSLSCQYKSGDTCGFNRPSNRIDFFNNIKNSVVKLKD